MSLLIELGPPPLRTQYTDIIREFAFSKGSQSTPIGIPLKALNLMLNQSVGGDRHGVLTSAPNHTNNSQRAN